MKKHDPWRPSTRRMPSSEPPSSLAVSKGNTSFHAVGALSEGKQSLCVCDRTIARAPHNGRLCRIFAHRRIMVEEIGLGASGNEFGVNRICVRAVKRNLLAGRKRYREGTS